MQHTISQNEKQKIASDHLSLMLLEAFEKCISELEDFSNGLDNNIKQTFDEHLNNLKLFFNRLTLSATKAVEAMDEITKLLDNSSNNDKMLAYIKSRLNTALEDVFTQLQKQNNIDESVLNVIKKDVVENSKFKDITSILKARIREMRYNGLKEKVLPNLYLLRASHPNIPCIEQIYNDVRLNVFPENDLVVAFNTHLDNFMSTIGSEDINPNLIEHLTRHLYVMHEAFVSASGIQSAAQGGYPDSNTRNEIENKIKTITATLKAKFNKVAYENKKLQDDLRAAHEDIVRILQPEFDTNLAQGQNTKNEALSAQQKLLNDISDFLQKNPNAEGYTEELLAHYKKLFPLLFKALRNTDDKLNNVAMKHLYNIFSWAQSRGIYTITPSNTMVSPDEYIGLNDILHDFIKKVCHISTEDWNTHVVGNNYLTVASSSPFKPWQITLKRNLPLFETIEFDLLKNIQKGDCREHIKFINQKINSLPINNFSLRSALRDYRHNVIKFFEYKNGYTLESDTPVSALSAQALAAKITDRLNKYLADYKKNNLLIFSSSKLKFNNNYASPIAQIQSNLNNVKKPLDFITTSGSDSIVNILLNHIHIDKDPSFNTLLQSCLEDIEQLVLKSDKEKKETRSACSAINKKFFNQAIIKPLEIYQQNRNPQGAFGWLKSIYHNGFFKTIKERILGRGLATRNNRLEVVDYLKKQLEDCQTADDYTTLLTEMSTFLSKADPTDPKNLALPQDSGLRNIILSLQKSIIERLFAPSSYPILDSHQKLYLYSIVVKSLGPTHEIAKFLQSQLNMEAKKVEATIQDADMNNYMEKVKSNLQTAIKSNTEKNKENNKETFKSKLANILYSQLIGSKAAESGFLVKMTGPTNELAQHIKQYSKDIGAHIPVSPLNINVLGIAGTIVAAQLEDSANKSRDQQISNMSDVFVSFKATDKLITEVVESLASCYADTLWHLSCDSVVPFAKFIADKITAHIKNGSLVDNIGIATQLVRAVWQLSPTVSSIEVELNNTKVESEVILTQGITALYNSDTNKYDLYQPALDNNDLSVCLNRGIHITDDPQVITKCALIKIDENKLPEILPSITNAEHKSFLEEQQKLLKQKETEAAKKKLQSVAEKISLPKTTSQQTQSEDNNKQSRDINVMDKTTVHMHVHVHMHKKEDKHNTKSRISTSQNSNEKKQAVSNTILLSNHSIYNRSAVRVVRTRSGKLKKQKNPFISEVKITNNKR